MQLQIQRLDKTIDMPAYIRECDVGLDLRSRENLVIDPGEKTVVKTGIALAIPPNFVGLIWDRSGLAAKNHITTMAGVIDPGYRGEVGVVLANLGKEPLKIEKNMRIAQLLIQPVHRCDIVEADSLDADTERGSNAWGSSGL